MSIYRVTVDLTHPEEVVADHAMLEANGALTFLDDRNRFIVTYAPGVWRKVAVIRDPVQPS